MPTAAEAPKSCLHLVASPGREVLAQCLGQFRQGDSLLFLDAGVTSLLWELPADEAFKGDAALYSAPDLAARGLLEQARREGLRLLEDSEFLDVLAQHDFCLTWK
jgi:sulfur relay protein TusB/DsrH